MDVTTPTPDASPTCAPPKAGVLLWMDVLLWGGLGQNGETSVLELHRVSAGDRPFWIQAKLDILKFLSFSPLWVNPCQRQVVSATGVGAVVGNMFVGGG